MQVGRVELIRLAATAALLLAAARGLQAQTGPAAVEPRFDILEFVIEGDTLLGAAAIERVVYRFLGPGRSVADADGARRALEAAYQLAGYLGVTVVLPPQNVGNAGEVRLQVVAAPIERLRVVGAQNVLPSRVREAVPSLAAGTVPNFNELQQELGTVPRLLPNADVTPVLTAGTQPATLAAELKVQDNLPLQGRLEINDKQSLDTTRGRLDVALSYDDLFQRGHALVLNWTVSPRNTRQANIFTASYALPLGGDSDRLSLAVTTADTNTPTAIGGTTVSQGQTWRLRWRDQLAAPQGLAHGLSWGLTARDLRDRTLQADGTDQGLTPLRYTTLQLGYDLLVSSDVAGRQTSLQAEWTVSPSGSNRRAVGCAGVLREQFACKRAGAEPRFQTLNMVLNHREPIGRWSFMARVQGQLADAPLAPAEQIVFGGEESVRGYFEGEQAADTGLSVRLELTSPGWEPWSGWSLSGFAFLDAAAGKRLWASSPDVVAPRLASGGMGLRVGSSSGMQATASLARVLQQTTRLVDGQQVPVSGSAANRAYRWHLNLRQSF